MQTDVQHAGFENIFPVLIFFAVIIAQLIKAGKKFSGGEHRPMPSGENDPRDEIRDFLETLTGDPRPPPRPPVAPPPLPPSPVVVPVKRVAPVAIKAPAHRRPTPRPAVRSAPEETVAASAQRTTSQAFSWDDAPRAEQTVTPETRDILKTLGGRGSLAKAIVLREILDAPLALRSRP